MNKKQFQELLIPLNETEQFYKDHPEDADRYFMNMNDVQRDQDGVLLLRENRVANQSSFHGSIIPGRSNGTPYQYIIFNKQTRFSRVPLHWHDYLELFYVYSGQCTATINGKQLVLYAGDVCIMDTQAVHMIDTNHRLKDLKSRIYP